MILPVLIDPAPQLREICKPVRAFDGALGVLALDLLQTLYHAKGRGLAAPQVGLTRRIFVTDTGWKEGAPSPRVFVNPEVTDMADRQVTCEEQCLSIPDTPVMVARPEWVDLTWNDLDGRTLDERFSGFAAICILHERDHLDGILITDKVAA